MQTHMAALTDSLRQHFGRARKATKRHVIFTIGADFFVLRHRKGELKLSLRVTEREQAQKARRAIAAERRWQEETAGL